MKDSTAADTLSEIIDVMLSPEICTTTPKDPYPTLQDPHPYHNQLSTSSDELIVLTMENGRLLHELAYLKEIRQIEEKFRVRVNQFFVEMERALGAFDLAQSQRLNAIKAAESGFLEFWGIHPDSGNVEVRSF